MSIKSIARRIGLNLAIATLGFVVGVLVVYVWWARTGPPLQPWHTQVLHEEFKADQAGEVRDLAGYLRVEERLFAEMDAEVYAVTPTGPDQALVRFSPGSASDPRDREPNWNRTFEIGPADAPAGVLLLHGMSDGPYSLRALGEALAGQGYRVLGLRLPGHGTIPSGLRDVTWEDMAAAVRLGVAHLADGPGGRPVHLIGYSTGAALALDYALDAREGRSGPSPASLVLVSPAIGITRAAAVTPWLDRLSHLPGLEQLGWTSVMPEFDPFNFNSFATNSSVQVHRMTRSVAARIRALSGSGPITGFPPTLVLLSAVDATVSTDAAVDSLLAHLGPGDHELLLYDINRFALNSPLIVSDPGPLIGRLMGDASLPFALTLITNESPGSRLAVARRKAPLSAVAEASSPSGCPGRTRPSPCPTWTCPSLRTTHSMGGIRPRIRAGCSSANSRFAGSAAS